MMRLPTITADQVNLEDRREWNEAIYAAHLHSAPLVICPVNHLEAQAYVNNDHRWWKQRGFRIRTKTVDRWLVIWLEPLKAADEAA